MSNKGYTYCRRFTPLFLKNIKPREELLNMVLNDVKNHLQVKNLEYIDGCAEINNNNDVILKLKYRAEKIIDSLTLDFNIT